MGDLTPLVVGGPRNDLAVDCAGQVIGGPQIIAVVVGVQLVLLIQQGSRTILNPLHHNRQPVRSAVHITIIQAVDLMLHQGLVGLCGEIHHELLDDSGGLLHVAIAIVPGIVGAIAVAVPLAIVAGIVRGPGIDAVVTISILSSYTGRGASPSGKAPPLYPNSSVFPKVADEIYPPLTININVR